MPGYLCGDSGSLADAAKQCCGEYPQEIGCGPCKRQVYLAPAALDAPPSLKRKRSAFAYASGSEERPLRFIISFGRLHHGGYHLYKEGPGVPGATRCRSAFPWRDQSCTAS